MVVFKDIKYNEEYLVALGEYNRCGTWRRVRINRKTYRMEIQGFDRDFYQLVREDGTERDDFVRGLVSMCADLNINGKLYVDKIYTYEWDKY